MRTARALRVVVRASWIRDLARPAGMSTLTPDSPPRHFGSLDAMRLTVDAECAYSTALRILRSADPLAAIAATRGSNLQRRLRAAYRRLLSRRERSAA